MCKVSGLLVEICADYIEELRNMRSFIRMEIFLKPGQHVKKTIDCFTLAGVVMVCILLLPALWCFTKILFFSCPIVQKNKSSKITKDFEKWKILVYSSVSDSKILIFSE